jgi:hypothetical protein
MQKQRTYRKGIRLREEVAHELVVITDDLIVQLDRVLGLAEANKLSGTTRP